MQDKYRIAAAPNSWDIQEKRTIAKSKHPEKVGTSSWVAFQFCANVEQASKRLLQILAAEKLETDHTLQDVIDAVKESEAEVCKVIREINPVK